MENRHVVAVIRYASAVYAWRVVLAIAGAGCAQSTGGDSYQGTYAEFAIDSARASCVARAACEPIAGPLIRPPTVEACVSYSLALAGEFEDDLLDSGRSRFDRHAAAACLAGYGGSCGGAVPKRCFDVLRGTMPNGAPCRLRAECESGACSIVEDGCGICYEPTREGHTCGDGQPPCEAGTVCVSSESGSRCETGLVSVSDASEGDACGFLPGKTVAICAPGLFCDATSHCARRLAPHEACAPLLGPCDVTTQCADGGSGTPRCLPVRVVSEAGVQCGGVGDEFIACDRDASLFCPEPGATCTLASGGRNVGVACASADECASQSCVDQRCAPRSRALGESCTFATECESGLCWVFTCADPNACR